MVDMKNPAVASYETANTALLAYLDSEGFKDWDMVRENGSQVKYVLNYTPQKLEPFIRDFKMARAQGNIVLFYESYKRILSQIKTGV